MKKLVLIIAFCVSFGGAAIAWPAIPGVYGAATSQVACGKPSPAGEDDGCTQALANGGLYRFPNWYNDARESGQGPYLGLPTYNSACIDVGYGCGPDTDDAHLTDFKSNVPSGWSVLVENQIYQNFGTATLNRYFLNDIGIFKSSGDFTLTNSHIRMGKNTCRSFNGVAPVNIQSATASLDAHNNLWDTSDECSWQAELYGTSYDPGLVQQFAANITIASNKLTINSGSIGFLAQVQFLNWSGITQQVAVVALDVPISSISISGTTATATTSSPHNLVPGVSVIMSNQQPTGYRGTVTVLTTPDSVTFTYKIQGGNSTPGGSATVPGTVAMQSCQGSLCDGRTFGVCQFIAAANSGACNATVTDVGPVNATTGPILPTANAAIRQAAVGGTPTCKIQYNVFWKYSTPGTCSTGGDTNVQFNIARITGHTSDHDNYFLNAGEPGAPTTIPYRLKFNVAWWDAHSPNTGTTLFGNFLTSNNNNKVGGVQISWDPFDVSYNIGITNKTQYPSANGNQTAAMWRALQQGTSSTIICNSAPTCAGTSISGNQLTVASVVSGAALAVGDAIDCGTPCTWTGAVRIASIDSGTGGAGSYTLNRSVGSISSMTALNAVRYYGILINQFGRHNFFDKTGAGTYFIFDAKNDVGTCDMSGNIDMITGLPITNPCP